LLYIEHTVSVNKEAHEMMTPAPNVAISPRMGRKLRWPERIGAKFAAGTLARIARVLAPKEKRLDFIREAVEREIERRARATSARKPAPHKRKG
jgi:hypothetical protein